MANVTPHVPVVPLDALPLRTEGRWILDSRNERFKLKCVNWFGASGELHVVHGLHKRSMHQLVSQVVSWGFNCVRLPFSLELFFTDPPVAANVLTADPLASRGNLTGMQAYDEAVTAITSAGLLVLVDNHSSESGWCCHAGKEDGVWFTPNYPESSWIEALAAMARRYRDNPRVFAIELRNELRDAEPSQIVWGEGEVLPDRQAVDWAAAAERAGNAVLNESSSLLVLVTGLCYAQDLRGSVERPLQLNVPGRLVWTTHTYHWFFWWHDGPLETYATAAGIIVMVLALFTCFSAAALLRSRRKAGQMITTLPALVEVGSCSIAVLGGYILQYATNNRANLVGNGCIDKGQRDARPFITAGVALLTVAGVALLLSVLWRLVRRQRLTRSEVATGDEENSPAGDEQVPTKRHPRCCLSQYYFPILLWLSLALGGIAFFFLASPSYWMLARQLNEHWGFVLEEGHDYTAPLLLGEFGSNRDSAFWRGVTQFIADKDLSFAYWALNGQKWSHDHDAWEDETYGLLDQSWTAERHSWKISSLFR